MDTPAKDVSRIAALLQSAREALQASRHAPAIAAAEEAQALDRLDPRAPELLAEIHRAACDIAQAERAAAHAKDLRQQAWKRAVEAEARGQHELMGEATRNELP